MKRLTFITILLASPAIAEPNCAVRMDPLSTLCELRWQLERPQGATVKLNGIDQTEALKQTLDAIFDLHHRLQVIEDKK